MSTRSSGAEKIKLRGVALKLMLDTVLGDSEAYRVTAELVDWMVDGCQKDLEDGIKKAASNITNSVDVPVLPGQSEGGEGGRQAGVRLPGEGAEETASPPPGVR